MNLRRSPRRVVFAAAVVGTIASLGVAVSPAQAACPDSCEAPSNVRGVASNKSRIQIAWNGVAGAPGYRIHYSTTSNFSANVKGVLTTNTGYVLPSLQPGTRYFFRVAVSTQTSPVRLSAWSNPIGQYATKAIFKMPVGTYNIKSRTNDATYVQPWTSRAKLQARAIVTSGLRLLGLQEAEDGETVELVRYLNEIAVGRSDGPYKLLDTSGSDDNLIVYDSRVLRRVNSGGREFACACEDGRNYAWGKFEHVPSGRFVLFTTTHLSPNSDSDDVKQWRELIRFAQDLISKEPKYSVIMTGDYNVTKFEQIGADMFAETRNAGFHDVLGQQHRRYSTYRNPTTKVDAWISTSNKGRRDVSTYSVSPEKNGNGIDHVFISAALKVPYYRVHAQPRRGNILDYLLSDHFLVIAIVAE